MTDHRAARPSDGSPQAKHERVSPEQIAARLDAVISEVQTVIVGQRRVVERTLVGLLAKGHLLLEGVPGVAKTLTVKTLADAVGGTFARIQFTPDLVPSDIVGTRIYRPGKEQFETELGPVFVNFLLTDEINRAPAKVQSALLEVMAEHQVSIGGTTYTVPSPFIVLATQNPIESEGVYPLPDAQRDRFLMKIPVDYPSAREERDIVYRMGGEPPQARQILTPEELVSLQRLTQRVFVDDAIIDYVVRLVLVTRTPKEHGLRDVSAWLTYGASPRASLGLIAAGRALALIRGRGYVLPQDVVDVIPDVLRHRLILSYDALADGVPVDHVISRVMQTVPPPQIVHHQAFSGAGHPVPQHAQLSARAYPPGPPAFGPARGVPGPAPQPNSRPPGGG